MSSDSFFITQSLLTNDDAIQKFKVSDHKNKSILNYFTIGFFGPNSKMRIDYIKDHVFYISQTPISSLNELATFYYVISTKEIRS